ncbi:RNA-binding protein, partial [Burkholderia pseudomallei]|nr:RNA-binding protein [Burkholderia pseudomallei]
QLWGGRWVGGVALFLRVGGVCGGGGVFFWFFFFFSGGGGGGGGRFSSRGAGF